MKGIIMIEYNTKSDMSEKAVIRTFRSNDFGTIFRFPIVGFLPDNIQATTDWFAKELRSSLYKVSCMMPFQTYNGVPRIVIDYKNEDPDHKSRMVILPYDLDGKYHYCIGVDEDGILIQTKMSNLLDKNLFTEVHDGPEDRTTPTSKKYKQFIERNIMNEYNTKSDIAEKVVIRTFRQNASGAIFRFPVVGLMPNNVLATASWFDKVLQPNLYKVSSVIPIQTGDDIPRIVINAFMLPYTNEDPEHKSEAIVILPYDVDETDCCTGINEKGFLVQIKKSNLFNKELFTEVHDRPEDPNTNWAAELRHDLVEFISSKDEHPSQDDKNAIVFCEEDRLKTLHIIDETLECGGFLHADWPYYAKNAVTQINIAFISDPKLYVRNVTSEKDLDRNCVKHYVVGELRQTLNSDRKEHHIIVYPIYRDSGSLSSVFTLIPAKYAYLVNGNTDEDDILYNTHIKEV